MPAIWKPTNAYKRITFTINLPDGKTWEDYDLETFRTRLNPDFLIMGKETCPTSGRKHFQGYMEFSRKKKGSAMDSAFRVTWPLPISVHFESSRGTAQENIEYCSKEDTMPFLFGEPVVKQGERTDLGRLAEMAKEGATDEQLIAANPGGFLVHQRGLKAIRMHFAPLRTEPSKLLFLWGPTGSGKTAAAYEAGVENIDRCRISGNRFLQGYTREKEIVLFDDFNWKKMDPLDFLELTDRYPCTFDVKNGEVKFGPKQIIFTSNFDPKTWWDEAPLETRQAIHRRMDEFGEIRYFDTVLGPGQKPPPRLTDFFGPRPQPPEQPAAPSAAADSADISDTEDYEHSQPSDYELEQRALKRSRTVVVDLTED